MIKGLTELEECVLMRLLPEEFERDEYGIPIMNSVPWEQYDFNGVRGVNFQNLKLMANNSKSLVLNFRYDRELERLWLNPLRYIPKLQTAFAVTTPDYSVAPQMDKLEMEHMIYKARWLGCFWQLCGINAIPVIPWTDASSYKLCFGNVAQGSVVAISTVGVKRNLSAFLEGFAAMQEYISPELIIVYGDMIAGMYGRFINYSYKSCLARKTSLYKQLTLPLNCQPYFEIRRCS